MKSEDITGGLDLLGDWLDAKGFTEEAGLCTKAMDEINALRAENARLKVALKPLAALRKEILDEKGQPSGDFSFDHYTDDQTVFFLDTKRIITAGDIRTAYQLLSNSQ